MVSNKELLQSIGEMLDEKLEQKLEQKLDEKLDEKLGQLEIRLEEKLEKKLEEKLEKKLEEKLEKKLEEKLEEKLDKKLEIKFDEKLTPIYERMDRMDGNIVALQEGQAELRQGLIRLENRVDDLYDVVVESWGELQETKKRVDRLEEYVGIA